MTQRLKQNPDFRQLKVGARNPLLSASYWLGRDHLLVVEIANYTERYRRFCFRDIQAVVLQQTNARAWWSFALAIVTAVCAFGCSVTLFVVFSSDSSETGALVGAVGFGLLLLLGVFGLVRSALLGPTCSVQIRTAVQAQRIRGLTRWRKAETLIKELAPLVQAAQAAPAGGEPGAAPQPAARPPAEIPESKTPG